MPRLDEFVAPVPKPGMIGAMTRLNRVMMLGGVPGLRDLPFLGRANVFQGICRIRHIDFPDDDLQRLASVCGAGKATFITPNHPEFFTDWMLDKEIISQTSPMAASWATHAVVNGMGSLAQKFWLSNNLIAQIPGKADDARRHSVQWASAGHAVLLHPEGSVGWHADYIAPLYSGAAEMGFEALETGRPDDAAFEAWVAPVVWKMAFVEDAEKGLHRELDYVEKKLDIEGLRDGANPVERVHAVYRQLLKRDVGKHGFSVSTGSFPSFHRELVSSVGEKLQQLVKMDPTGGNERDILRHASRWMRDNDRSDDVFNQVRGLQRVLTRLLRLDEFAWSQSTVTQEQAAEHIKRIRNDYCKGTLRDTANAYVPRPVALRRVRLRTPEPLALHLWKSGADAAMTEIRARMQNALDSLVAQSGEERAGPLYDNPFE